jgi:hypothetical protein
VTPTERVRAIEHLGFSQRQAGFLATVVLHAGVCVARQYCAYARIVRGQKVQDFFHRLVDGEFATPHVFGHRKARIYHLHHRALYRAVGEPDARFRKRAALGRAVERLMLLDHVLGERDLTWLATEREKVQYFTHATPLRPDELPHVRFGRDSNTTIRYFAEKLPIGVDPEGREHVFVYLVTNPHPGNFRLFLHRHAELLRALPSWTVRALFPKVLLGERRAFELAFYEECGSPLRSVDVEEFSWLRRQPRATLEADLERARAARRRFASPRFRALERACAELGDRALDASQSPVLADAVKRGTGRIECQILPRQYYRFLSLVGTA